MNNTMPDSRILCWLTQHLIGAIGVCVGKTHNESGFQNMKGLTSWSKSPVEATGEAGVFKLLTYQLKYHR